MFSIDATTPRAEVSVPGALLVDRRLLLVGYTEDRIGSLSVAEFAVDHNVVVLSSNALPHVRILKLRNSGW